MLVSLVVGGCGCGGGDSARSRSMLSLESGIRSVFVRRQEERDVSDVSESRERLGFWFDEFVR